ncbi:hypothetical protein IscW_ISCW020620 [Ixodes scapularis]|uniref:Uncharacterized protein n=1 Tax=Ixodes scapularis TaxID=6945 RepID=B7Q2L6_IXOSC|nr:hypothetical protein IscW_ISCW020620 [Ixodes scapularis]|eukprot:XP_002410896.1 hypothetical protein IscW_ISCW020620 [Ixodes scapularis]
MFRVPRRAPSLATTSTSLEDDEGVDTPQPSEAMPPPTQAPLRRPSTRPALLPNASLDDGAFTVSDLDESSACVVVVSPVAARRNAASAAYSPRHRRPPTPVEGDGFPSVADDPNSMLANSSNAVDTGGSSGGRPDDDSGAGRVGRHPRYYYQVRGIPFGYGNGASAPSLAKPSASPPESAPLPEDPEEFEHRLRQMVSRFWVPFLAVTSPPVQARERRSDDVSPRKRDETTGRRRHRDVGPRGVAAAARPGVSL